MIKEKVAVIESDNKYDGVPGFVNSTHYMEEISKSVVLINSIAYYSVYKFAHSLKLSKIKSRAALNKKDYYEHTSKSSQASGTAVILSNAGGKILLLTAAHIVKYPDTLFNYYNFENDSTLKFIESISIKENEENFIADFPGSGKAEIIAYGDKIDAALLGIKNLKSSYNSFPEFNYPFGTSEDLEWGSFVYVFGFPMNRKMISSALVSRSQRTIYDDILIDAVFNKGFSGGIVIAIKDGLPNFELVGIVSAAPAESNLILKPSSISIDDKNLPPPPYKGDIIVKKELTIKYGITKVTSVDAIKKFFESNKEIIKQHGYSVSHFLSN